MLEYTEDYYLTMDPTAEDLVQCEKDQKLMIVLIPMKDYLCPAEFLEKWGLPGSRYLFGEMIGNDEPFEDARTRVLTRLKAVDTSVWFAPAGTKRGTLSSLELKGYTVLELAKTTFDEDVVDSDTTDKIKLPDASIYALRAHQLLNSDEAALIRMLRDMDLGMYVRTHFEKSGTQMILRGDLKKLL